MWYKRVKFEQKEVPFTLTHEWEERERERFVLIWFEPFEARPQEYYYYGVGLHPWYANLK